MVKDVIDLYKSASIALSSANIVSQNDIHIVLEGFLQNGIDHNIDSDNVRIRGSFLTSKQPLKSP